VVAHALARVQAGALADVQADRVATLNAGSLQRAGQTPGALVGLSPVPANLPMDDRRPLTVDFRCAHDEIDRR
jgi:hypothetical protein